MEQPILPLVSQYKRYYHTIQPFLDKPQTRTYSTAIFFFLVLSLFGWYAIRPTIQTILSLQKEIVDKTAVNKQMDDKINALIEAQSAYEAVQQQLTVIDEAIPPDANVLSLVAKMKTLAQSTGATISALTVNQTPLFGTDSSTAGKIKKTQSAVITASLEGSYASLITFIDGLLSFRRVVSFDSLSFVPLRLSPTRESTLSGAIRKSTLRLSLSLITYFIGN